MKIGSSAPYFCILLSTHNGENFLPEFLDSVLAQEYPLFEFHVRDDGSTDDTRNILANYAKRHPDRFYIYSGQTGAVGPSRSYSQLLKTVFHRAAKPSPAVWYAYADQDDIWLPGKLQLFADMVKALDDRKPFLVHSDMRVVDASLNPIAESFMQYQGLHPEKNKTFQLGMLNVVVGCTMVINRALAEFCLDQPDAAVMHDWWIALLASLKGKILYSSEKLVLYRQHGMNFCGANPDRPAAKRDFKQWRQYLQTTKQFYTGISAHAKAFYSKYRNEMEFKDRMIFKILIRIPRSFAVEYVGYLMMLKFFYKVW